MYNYRFLQSSLSFYCRKEVVGVLLYEGTRPVNVYCSFTLLSLGVGMMIHQSTTVLDCVRLIVMLEPLYIAAS